MSARLSVAAGGALTLVPSCDGERGEPELHRWCQGRAPPVSWPPYRLQAQTGSKRSKGRAAALLHDGDNERTYKHVRNQASDVQPAVVNTPSPDSELLFLSQIQMANEGPHFFLDTRLSTEG